MSVNQTLDDSQSRPRQSGTLDIATHADLSAIHLNRRDRRRVPAAVRYDRPYLDVALLLLSKQGLGNGLKGHKLFFGPTWQITEDRIKVKPVSKRLAYYTMWRIGLD